MNPIRQRADRLRAIPLQSVLQLWGARPDRHDKSKWHTSRGTLSVNGSKFINWNHGGGGGGAIDLLIHLGNFGFKEALDWLHQHFPSQPLPQPDRSPSRSALKLPSLDPFQLGRIKRYLLTERALESELIDSLIQSGNLYADHRANAVFLLLGESAIAVGAELRGTTARQWRGMAPGSRKNLGYFSIPSATAAQDPRPIILCESAIDAISCFLIHPDHRCISTSGARPNPSWLPALINHGHRIYCGFDVDDTGESMAHAMIAFHPSVKRLRPHLHDWNDLLRSRV